jgi:hypothetical protein
MQNKEEDESGAASPEAKRRGRPSKADALRAQAASLGVPVFAVRMFGWRKVRLVSGTTAPQRRHD